MIKKLDLNDDTIVMSQKIRSIEQDFCNIVIDEEMLSKSMEYINDQVLQDSDASLKFAILFASRPFDSLAMNDIKVRSKMLTILQENYRSADDFRKQDRRILYNSITLLGEYYHRIRLVNGVPITVLGESLLEQLIKELSLGLDGLIHPVDYKLAKLILSQITLNGSLLRPKHKEALDALLFLIRRSLIELPTLTEAVKALLLMTLDLYYNDFNNLGDNLETMYTKYLIEEENSEPASLNTTLEPNREILPPDDQGEHSPEIMKSKWSEEVPDAFVSSFIENDSPHSATDLHSPSNTDQDRLSPVHKTNSNYNMGYDDDRHSIRSEGGSIRLYNVNDRLRRAQRNNGGNGGGWERNYNSYDRNRRSSSRNSNNQYDNNRNYRNKNNRGYNTYNRPPRFSNNELWRNGSDYGGSRQNLQGSNSRSSSQNRDRYPPRSRYDNYGGRSASPTSSKQSFSNPKGKDNFNRHNGFNRNPQQQQHRQQSRNFAHNRSNRYGSHNSLTSDTGTWERRGRRRNSRGKSEDYYSNDDTRSLHDNQNDDDWHAPTESNELIKNARNTTDYMKFLSKK